MSYREWGYRNGDIGVGYWTEIRRDYHIARMFMVKALGVLE